MGTWYDYSRRNEPERTACLYCDGSGLWALTMLDGQLGIWLPDGSGDWYRRDSLIGCGSVDTALRAVPQALASLSGPIESLPREMADLYPIVYFWPGG